MRYIDRSDRYLGRNHHPSSTARKIYQQLAKLGPERASNLRTRLRYFRELQASGVAFLSEQIANLEWRIERMQLLAQARHMRETIRKRRNEERDAERYALGYRDHRHYPQYHNHLLRGQRGIVGTRPADDRSIG